MPIHANSSSRPRMTAAEYAEALRLLHSSAFAERKPGETAKDANERRADQEFLLSIDYRLGQDFPSERRQLLLDAHRAMRRALARAISLLVRGVSTPEVHAVEVQRLVEQMSREFSSILAPDEYEAFMGVPPGEV